MIITTSNILLDKNRGIIFNMDISTDEIYQHIENNLSIRTIEKNKYGEVFTPVKYINELLDQLPSCVWNSSSLRWLEPASGIGHFCLVIYARLMSGLSGEFIDRIERHDHIIKNMLFMVELNSLNVKRSIEIFGSDANIVCADFLTLHENIQYSNYIKNIDIIIGNPPFQTPHDGNRKSGKGGKILWDKFILKSIDILRYGYNSYGYNVNNDRFLCFITPPGWRKPNSELWPIMTSYNNDNNRNYLQYLHNIDKKTAMKELQVQQRMDIFVIKCINEHTPTPIYVPCTIKTGNLSKIIEYTNIIPIDWPFLPNSNFDLIKSILDISCNSIHIIPKQYRVIYDRMAYASDTKHMSKTKSTLHIFPVVHTMNKKGIGLWYSNTKNNGHFGIPKIILNFNEKLYPYLDASGEYGMGQSSFGLPITSTLHGHELMIALKSDKFNDIIKSTKWGAFQTDWRMFLYFKDDFYKSFLD